MTRNVKAFGLTLVAAFAMTAVMASGAQALKITTGTSPAWLTGEQVAGEPHTFTIENGGPVLSCTTAKFSATAKNKDETVTVIPTYAGCSGKIGTETFPAKVTMNDCDYFFHGGVEETSTTFKEVEVDVKCPAGKIIEVHLYKNVAETEELCTLTIAEQLNKKENVFHNEGSGSTNDVKLTTEVTVNVTRDGSLLCGKASNGAIYKGNTTIKAFEDIGGTVSEGTIKGLEENNQVSLTVSK